MSALKLNTDEQLVIIKALRLVVDRRLVSGNEQSILASIIVRCSDHKHIPLVGGKHIGRVCK